MCGREQTAYVQFLAYRHLFLRPDDAQTLDASALSALYGDKSFDGTEVNA